MQDIFESVHGRHVLQIHTDSASSNGSSSGDMAYTGYYDYLLHNSAAASAHNQEDMRPLPSQMLFLWQTYIENVDPFIKVLHVPTMGTAIRSLKGKYNSLSFSMQALVLAVSLAAIMSLEDDEVMNSNIIFIKVASLIYFVIGSDELQH